ncbi:hypothetical protein ABT278_35690 [Streptomyces sp. NPDC001228]|uniref:hypothetical protein n=1 Tax=Streptomyces sp. NPDC001228 TaxID=3154381 RepID=UPI00331E2BBA
MSTVDDLLARSLLHHPQVPSDVVPYNDHAEDDLLPWAGYWPDEADDSAAARLAALCEAVVTHSASEKLADFLTDQVPEPHTARILGCALHVAGADIGARFWWQYAAGADDTVSAYCLYLHHLAQGDTHAAALWHGQAGAYAPPEDFTDAYHDAPAYRMMTADTSLVTVLRILSHLTRATPRPHTPTTRALIQFVARAVTTGYALHPDCEIPVPGTRFAERLGNAIEAASNSTDCTCPIDEAEPAEELPNRLPSNPGARGLPSPPPAKAPEHLDVEVTAASHEAALADGFFEKAAAVCWKTATAADATDTRSNRRSYRLRRFVQTYAPAPSGFNSIRAAAPSVAASACFHRL